MSTLTISSDQPIVYFSGKHRSKVLARACCTGLRSIGLEAIKQSSQEYEGPIGRFSVFYGLSDRLHEIFKDHQKAGRPFLHIDLGYWGRREGGKYVGYHKAALNARHPSSDLLTRKEYPSDRFDHFKLTVRPWLKSRRDSPILLAGMSEKAAHVDGFEFEEWERRAIKTLKRHTNRTIIYRPKPSERRARHIPGTNYSSKNERLEGILRQCHAIVTHHSNVSIDGAIEGVPSFCWDGAGTLFASQDLSQIENPYYPENRQQLLNALAYCQWKVDEFRSGEAFRYFLDEGLLP